MAYCNGGNGEMSVHCTSYLFPNEIAAISFNNNSVKQNYFSLLQQLYVVNRSLILQRLYDTVTSACPSCSLVRMQLTPPPVFPSVFTAQGGVSSGVHLPVWLDSVFTNAQNGDTTGISRHVGQIQDSLNSIGNLFCQEQINAVLRSLANCASDTSYYSSIRGFLTARCTGNGAEFTPQVIDSAIAAAGLSKNDLCHAFLVTYGLFAPVYDENTRLYACGDSALYAGLKSFLNRSDVKNAITDATTYSGGTIYSGLTLNPSDPFESKLKTRLGNPSTFSIQGFDQNAPQGTAGAPQFVKLRIQGNDSFALYLRSQARTNAAQLNGQSGFSFTDAICLNNDLNSATIGLVAQNAALVTATVGGTPTRYYVWSKDLALMSSADASSIAGCVTCMDIKRGLEQFYADSATYHYDPVFNHPLYATTLTSYLNYKLQKRHTYRDYVDLMKGCALSNQADVKRYLATYELVFSSATAAKDFNDALLTVGGNAIPDNFMFKDGSSVRCWLNLGSVDKNEVRLYKNYLDNYTTGVTGRTYRYGKGNAVIMKDTAAACSTLSVSSFGSLSSYGAIALGADGDAGGYTFYTFTSAGSTLTNFSDDIAGVRAAVAAQCPSAIYFPGRELLRSADYGSTAKTDFLSYVYGMNSSGHDAIVTSIAPNILQASLTPFAGKSVTYDDPLCRNKKRDLYLYTSLQSSHAGYVRADSILKAVPTLFPIPLSTTVNSKLRVFQKANGLYWYRYFGAGNQLYNMYIVPPIIDSGVSSGYILDSIRVAQGGDSSRFFKAYVHYGAKTAVCAGYADFTLGYSQKLENVVLLDKGGDDYCIDTADCEHSLLAMARANGRQAYRLYNDSLNRVLSDSMIRYVINNTKDTLRFCYWSQKYHYTLYYYDRAGNLERTVPPAGIRPVTTTLDSIADARESSNVAVNSKNKTSHEKVTVYRYDAQNRKIYEHTPDAGSTYYFYNVLGNLAFSQNSRQRLLGRYTYIIYDDLNRPIETGEAPLGLAPSTSTDIDTTRRSYPADGGFPASFSLHPIYIENCAHYSFAPDTLRKLIRSKTRTDVVVTTYDTAYVALQNITGYKLPAQQYLQHRVSAIAYYPSIYPNFPNLAAGGTPKFTTHYSYDMSGNVSTLVHDFLPLAAIRQRYKRIDYEYDLHSGKVNMVAYNRGGVDQFYQRYEYDADNRITKAFTSNDGLIWNTDARYDYYLHGPLARVQLGDVQIQSLEYAYTINGWLKAINSDVRRPDLDMGRNGGAGDATYARDVIAHALSYYSNDYKPVANTPATYLPGPSKSLYNGNIAQQTTAIANVGNMQRTYRYDQLQRLKLTGNANVDESALTVATPSNLYKSMYAYDPDGNITKLARWDGAGTQFDSLIYQYDLTAVNNKLVRVMDMVSTSPSSYTDIKHNQPTVNYAYDATGNLIKDKQGHLSDITWTMNGKVRSITDTVSGQVVYYDYDGMGNRIQKEVVNDLGAPGEEHKSEYYVRDAGGNILATYRRDKIYKSTILALNHSIAAVSLPDYHTFISGDLWPLSNFKAALMAEALANLPNWVDSELAAVPPSVYYAANSTWESNMLGSTNDWVDSLRAYQNINSLSTIQDALVTATTTNSSDAVALVEEIINSGTTEYTELMTNLDMAFSPGTGMTFWSMHVPSATYMMSNAPANASAWVGASPPPPSPNTVAGDIVSTLSSNATDNAAFWNLVFNNNNIWYSSALRHTNWYIYLGNILANYGSQTALGGFYDTYWPTTPKAWAAANTSASDRLDIAYDHDATLAARFADRVSEQTFASLIENDCGISFSAYVTLINNSASGVAIYTGPTDTMRLAEHHIYGSSRIGVQTYAASEKNVWQENVGVLDSSMNRTVPWYGEGYGQLVNKDSLEPWGNGDGSTGYKAGRSVGLRYYELSDHLGNVLATVLDRKTGVKASSGDTVYSYWKADVATATDYYPFGMEMMGRTYSASIGLLGKFGFNGQMKDNEIAGVGNSLDFKFRAYDPRIARFRSVDPLAVKYPYYSTYQFAGCNPIKFIDLEGLEPFERPISLNTPLKLMSYHIPRTAMKLGESRGGRIAGGVMNLTTGTLGAIGSGGYMIASDGVGAGLGGLAAFNLSVGEMAIGVAQIIDAFNDKPKLPDVGSVPGLLVSRLLDEKYVKMVDGAGQVLPAVLTGGHTLKNPFGLAESYKAFKETPNLATAIGLYDNVMDVAGFTSSIVGNSSDMAQASTYTMRSKTSTVANGNGTSTTTMSVDIDYSVDRSSWNTIDIQYQHVHKEYTKTE